MSFKNVFKGDKGVLMVFFLLCIISIIEVYSASSMLTYKTGNYLSPIIKHVGILLVGISCMVVTLHIKCKYFKMFLPFLLCLSVMSLLAALVLGESTNDSQRWVSFLGIQFQPSEIAKGTMVLATAQILSAMQTKDGADRHAFKYILIVGVVLIGLIMSENLSTAVLLSVVIFFMMIIGRVPARQLLKLAGVVGVFVLVVITAAFIFGETPQSAPPTGQTLTEQTIPQKKETSSIKKLFHRLDTWKARIYRFADNKELAPEEVDLDKNSQEAYANVAIATSNFVGKGPGNSEERDFLPQAFSDFIYAIIIEELGFAGGLVVALLYVILLFRTGRIAGQCENAFPAFLAMGLALMLVLQALFNMCVAVGIAPVTGQPLPLVSKGGTSSIINCIYIGVILSVSRTAKKRNENLAPQSAE